ncbi:MAG: PKD domain-containing protein [Candidatus Pseudobacter hemicellulosilyticus]|uniref:PKD domain-containing protein n=1 Tax=Candidatus Pseudobacter hemicellulosilyticus TaxID=3121375 RepID=A0AAJ5WPU0_9BACT|nr:MAG: PKD domain-containing protein [Pseudobacter sp.]
MKSKKPNHLLSFCWRSGAAFLLYFLATCPTLYAQLKANFTIDKTGGCSPLTVSFTNTSTGASPTATWHWDLGNGNQASTRDAGAIYTQEQEYTITLTVTDGQETSTFSRQLTVYQRPAADFSVSKARVCLPDPAVFTGSSAAGSGAITSYYWDFGDGNTQKSTTPVQSHQYVQDNIYSVSLTVTNSYGCHHSIQKQQVVEARVGINALFAATKEVLCQPGDPVSFPNLSSGPGPLIYSWDFGDGQQSNTESPTHVYGQKGTYTVNLTASNAYGCTSSAPSVEVNVANYSTDFSVPSPICTQTLTQFASLSNPIPDPYTSSWEIDGSLYTYGNTAQYPFYTPGTHTVSLTNTFGSCTQTTTKQVIVQPEPDIRPFSTTLNGSCGAPVTVNFKDNTTDAVSWKWQLTGNANGPGSTLQQPAYTYTSNGLWVVQLTVSNAIGCSAELVQTVNIQPPTVSISYSSSSSTNGLRSCGPLTVQFTSSNSEPIAQYQWDFGDGGTAGTANPQHTFSIAGKYQVKMSYTTVSGCTGTVYLNGIAVSKVPKLDFTASATEVCGDQPVVFTLQPNDASVTLFTWDMGEWPIVSTPGPSNSQLFRYHEAGYKTIKLTAKNENCDTIITKTNYIRVLPPEPIISQQLNTCDGTRGELTLTHSSIGANTVTWDFGDGQSQSTPATTLTVKHTYARTGTYTIKLTAVKDQCSVSTSTMADVLLKQQPRLTSNQTVVCKDGVFSFVLSNLENNPRPQYSWQEMYYYSGREYGDNSQHMGPVTPGYIEKYKVPVNGQLQYLDEKQDKIRFILTSNIFGCQDTTNYIPFTVQGVNAGFEVVKDKQCYQQAVEFRDTSKSIGSTITSISWDFGDGSTATGAGAIQHTYSNPGRSYVRLTATDGSGCNSATAYYGQAVEVYGPKAAFTSSATSVQLNGTVRFTNNSKTYNNIGTLYEWNFGDGSTASTYDAIHQYRAAGIYTVVLKATDPNTGCESFAPPVAITVAPFSTAFTVTTTAITGKNCAPVLASFRNNSTGFAAVSWDFGDGITSHVVNPSHIYEKAGKYMVTLTVYDGLGFPAQHQQEVVISMPEAVLQTVAAEGCIGHSPTLNAIGEKTSSYTWDLGDGRVLQSPDSTAQFSYTAPGEYRPSVLLSDGSGCIASATAADKVIIHPDPVVSISPAQPGICLGASTPLLASGGATYQWTPATGLSDAGIANPLASPRINTTYTVKAKDALGCTGSSKVTVQVVQPVALQLPATARVCAGNELTLQASGADQYSWIFDTDGLSAIDIPNPIAKPQQSITYTLKGSDTYGCFNDTARIAITVLPVPTVYAGTDQEVFAGNTFPLQPVYSSDVTRWAWEPAQYLSCSNCPAPVVTPLASKAYALTVYNQHNCKATDTVLVTLLCAENRIAIPNVFSPNNDGVNDTWTIKGISEVKHVVLFNRYGQKVFERSQFIAGSANGSWDGNFNGYPQPPGSYVYIVELQCPGGGVFTKKGSLVLVR